MDNRGRPPPGGNGGGGGGGEPSTPRGRGPPGGGGGGGNGDDSSSDSNDEKSRNYNVKPFTVPPMPNQLSIGQWFALLAHRMQAASHYEDGMEAAWIKMVLDATITFEQLGASSFGIKELNLLYGLTGKRKIKKKRMHKIDTLLSVLLQEMIAAHKLEHPVLFSELERRRHIAFNQTNSRTLAGRQVAWLLGDSLRTAADGEARGIEVLKDLIDLPWLGDSLAAMSAFSTWWTTLSIQQKSLDQKQLEQVFMQKAGESKVERIQTLISNYREAEAGTPKKTLSYLERGLALYITDEQRRKLANDKKNLILSIQRDPERLAVTAFSACPAKRMGGDMIDDMEPFANTNLYDGQVGAILQHRPKGNMSQEDVEQYLEKLEKSMQDVATRTAQQMEDMAKDQRKWNEQNRVVQGQIVPPSQWQGKGQQQQQQTQQNAQLGQCRPCGQVWQTPGTQMQNWSAGQQQGSTAGKGNNWKGYNNTASRPACPGERNEMSRGASGAPGGGKPANGSKGQDLLDPFTLLPMTTLTKCRLYGICLMYQTGECPRTEGSCRLAHMEANTPELKKLCRYNPKDPLLRGKVPEIGEPCGQGGQGLTTIFGMSKMLCMPYTYTGECPNEKKGEKCPFKHESTDDNKSRANGFVKWRRGLGVHVDHLPGMVT